MSMRPLKIISIEKIRIDKVYDIHHKIEASNFKDEHPNLIANSLIISNCSRHAGGICISDNLNEKMPLIMSGGIIQTPWTEGINSRHLEPMGFIKFDVLGISTLSMMDTCIRHILKRHKGIQNPTNHDVVEYYNNFLHPDNIDFNDEKTWKIFDDPGKLNIGVFQFTGEGAQEFCKAVSPRNIFELSNITAIYRPGPLSANVNEAYVEAKNNVEFVKYEHPILEQILSKTYGHIVYQEDIASIAHGLGKNISLEEGNKLRKILTKKGIGKKDDVKEKIKNKFIAGAREKGLSLESANDLFHRMESFAQYGFNLSHSVSYVVLSYQCAWLLSNYPDEWMVSFLDKEPEKKKEKAISVIRYAGKNIIEADINISETNWSISPNGSLIQPLTSIKGLGEKSVEQIMNNRPYFTIEEFIFNENIIYSKLNKRSLDILIRSGTLNSLMDKRFKNLKHFWACVSVNRPKNEEELRANIEAFKDEEDFSENEKVNFKAELLGVYPIEKVVSASMLSSLKNKGIPPISEFENDLQYCWCIPRSIEEKLTKTGKKYWVVGVIDSNFEMKNIRFWGINPEKNTLLINHVYILQPKYDPKWGFSVNKFERQVRRIT